MTVNGFQVQLTDNVRDVLESIKGNLLRGLGINLGFGFLLKESDYYFG